MTQIEQQNVPALRFPGFEEAWQRDILGEQCSITTGRLDANAMINGGKYPFFTCAREVYEIDTPAFDTEALLISGNGANVGYIHYYNGKFNAYQRTYVLDGFTQDIQFVQRSLERGLRKRIFSEVKEGNTPYIVKGTLTDMPINIPTLPEQQKIAGFLGAVDERIAQVTRKKALLEDYKKGCMQQLFSQSTRFKDDQGNDFPDWEEKRLGEVFSWVNTNSLSRERLTYEGGKVQNIHYGDIHTKFSANFHQGSEDVPFVKDAEPGDFKDDLFCKVGDVIIADASEDYADIGKAIEVVELTQTPLVAGLHTFIARPASTDLKVGFSGYLLRCEDMRRQIMRIAQGISVLGVSKRNLEKLTLSLPYPDEQQKIADFLSAIDTKIDLVAQELEQAKTFKKGLLQQMFV